MIAEYGLIWVDDLFYGNPVPHSSTAQIHCGAADLMGEEPSPPLPHPDQTHAVILDHLRLLIRSRSVAAETIWWGAERR